jgi:hypothetical protein
MSKIIMMARLTLLLPILCLGTLVASASEVTGTLSTGVDQTTTGGGSQTGGTLGSTVSQDTLAGTVTDGNSSGGNGGNSSRSGNNRDPNGNGSVLGLSDSRTLAVANPTFPNTGFDPDEDDEEFDIWETLFALATISFLAYAGLAYRPKQY